MPYRPNFPIPPDIDPPRKCLCIQIPSTNEHKQVIAGLFWELTQWFSWQRDAAHSGKALAQVYRDVFNSIDWSEMSCCCDQPTTPILHRATQAGALEVSYDNGASWITDPTDPRLTGTAMPPPIPPTVGTAKCDAATNGLEHFKDLVAKHSGDMAVATTAAELIVAIAAELVALVFAPEAAPAIIPILVATVTALFALGKTAYDGYFTNAVWDKILCILFCNIEDNGTFTDSGYQQLLIDIGTKLPAGVQRDMTYRDFIAMGRIGLNNICSYGTAADADCSGCSCDSSTCWEFDFGEAAFPVTAPLTGYGVWESGNGWRVPYFSGFDQLDAVFRFGWGGGFHITKVEFDSYAQVAGCRSNVLGVFAVGDDTTPLELDGAVHDSISDQEWLNDSHDVSSGTLFYLKKLRLYSTDEMSFDFGHPCPPSP